MMQDPCEMVSGICVYGEPLENAMGWRDCGILQLSK